MVRRVALTLTLLFVIAGCGPAAQNAMGDNPCVNRVLRAVLTVDVDDPRTLWATNASGITIPLRLPEGYGVTEDNKVIDAEGQPFAQTGDLIVGGCSDLLQDALLITEANIRHQP